MLGRMAGRGVGLGLRAGQRRRLGLSARDLGRVVQFNLSDIGEGIAEVEVRSWAVAEGATVAQFDELCEVQSDKATVTITSRYDGVVRKLHYAVDDVAKVGQPLVDIELDDDADDATDTSSSAEVPTAAAPAAPASVPASPPSSGAPREAARKALATPAVRRLAKERSVDIADVAASGKFGHVLKEDVFKFLQARDAGSGAPSGQSAPSPVAAAPPRVFESGVDRTEPIRGYARTMVKTMSAALAIPHFGYCDEVCVDRLVSLRTELAELAQEKGVKMSYMPLFIKAASLALKRFPQLNASLDEKVENLTYRGSHNICVAMDTPQGLLVPNIKHCEQKNLWEIAADLNRLHEAGKRSGIPAADLQDGTFTLSNIGSIGGTYASPVIFPPQVAIGALGKILLEARYEGGRPDGALRPTQLVKVSWSADHRVVDGATMARFSNAWKRYLENPGLMIAEMK